MFFNTNISGIGVGFTLGEHFYVLCLHESEGAGGGGGGTDVAGSSPELPDLSLEGPFDVHQDRPISVASLWVLDGMRDCQYRMTSYD